MNVVWRALVRMAGKGQVLPPLVSFTTLHVDSPPPTFVISIIADGYGIISE